MKKVFLIILGVFTLNCTKPKEPQVSVDTINVEKNIDKPEKDVSPAPVLVVESENDNKPDISTPDNGDKQDIPDPDDSAAQKPKNSSEGVYNPPLSNIFEEDVFEGIGETEEYYRDNPDFIVKNYDVKKPNYESTNTDFDFLYAKAGITRRASVEGKGIYISYYYWDTYGHHEFVTVESNNAPNKWGKYIGMDKDSILALFDHPYEEGKTEIVYMSPFILGKRGGDTIFYDIIFVRFELENDIVTNVSFGYAP